jgi:hypothetical protein
VRQLPAQGAVKVPGFRSFEIALHLKANNPRTCSTTQHTTQKNNAFLYRQMLCLSQYPRDPLTLGRRKKPADGL